MSILILYLLVKMNSPWYMYVIWVILLLYKVTDYKREG